MQMQDGAGYLLSSPCSISWYSVGVRSLSLFLSVSLCVSLSVSLSLFSLSVGSLSFIQALATVWMAAKRLGPHAEFPMLAHMVLYISYQKMPFLLGVGAARHTA